MIIRRQNWLGQQRVDVSHLRALGSSVAADFDLLAGNIFAGRKPLVVSGLDLITTAAVGNPATALRLQVADSVVLHPLASEAGTIFRVPEGTAAEILSGTNAKIDGSWVPGQVNYLGLDLRRSIDATTADLVTFLDADTLLETNKTVPLARTLNYRLIIGTTDFSALANVLPLALVTTDANNNVVTIEDARPMAFRLGSGGTTPDTLNSYPWPGGRDEVASGTTFSGGDKAISSIKDWMDAVMTRLWEQGGGEYWYSASTDRNVNLVWTGTPFSNGENFEWDGTHLHWKGLRYLFDNSTAHYNSIVDEVGNVVGRTDLADGDCLYVDLDRTSISATPIPQKATLTTLGPGSIPGSRQVLAWRVGSSVYTRGWRYPVGTTFTTATTTSLGMVALNNTPESAGLPKVVSIMADGRAEIAATANNSYAFRGTAHGSGHGIEGYGGNSFASGGLYGAGGTVAGAVGGFGVIGTGGLGNTQAGSGVYGLGRDGAGAMLPGMGLQGKGGNGTAGSTPANAGGLGAVCQGGTNGDATVTGSGAGAQFTGGDGTEGGHGCVNIATLGTAPTVPRIGSLNYATGHASLSGIAGVFGNIDGSLGNSATRPPAGVWGLVAPSSGSMIAVRGEAFNAGTGGKFTSGTGTALVAEIDAGGTGLGLSVSVPSTATFAATIDNNHATQQTLHLENQGGGPSLVAVGSVDVSGSVTTTTKFDYSAARTRVVHVPLNEVRADTSSSLAAYTASTPARDYWMHNSASGSSILGVGLHIPPRATLTAVELFLSNSHSAKADVRVWISKLVYAGDTTDCTASYLNANGLTGDIAEDGAGLGIPAATSKWCTVALAGTPTAPDNTGSLDGRIFMSINLPGVSTGTLLLRGIRVTFTYQDEDATL